MVQSVSFRIYLRTTNFELRKVMEGRMKHCSGNVVMSAFGKYKSAEIVNAGKN